MLVEMKGTETSYHEQFSGEDMASKQGYVVFVESDLLAHALRAEIDKLTRYQPDSPQLPMHAVFILRGLPRLDPSLINVVDSVHDNGKHLGIGLMIDREWLMQAVGIPNSSPVQLKAADLDDRADVDIDAADADDSEEVN